MQTKWCVVHCVSKNFPPLACYNFDTSEWILIFSGRNVADKVRNQTTLYYATSNNLCFCANCQSGETRKSHFHSNSILPEFNQLLDFLNRFDSRLILMVLYDSLNLVINAFSSGLLGGMVQEKGSRQRCRSWIVLHAQCTSARRLLFSYFAS